ncbi:MAG: FAD-dependent oxidoreductase [Verrucomicrobia bacterium]|jgi:glycerol-3-phosphate dehydrogenase|nr:FAD-dependent oxidoreductase [Verrucomicrobiota bacterium]
MQRDLKQLADTPFDITVIGGGIYGAAIAREAALRGLTVAVIDKGDFCCATSANSLKIIHGGLRYLQQADIIRVRESVRERRAMLRIAPHLIRPLPCLMPTTGVLKSKAAMLAGVLANDILSADRNRGVDADHRVPRGKIISRRELEKRLPGYRGPGTGAALWNDAVANDTERIVVEMVQSATSAGACTANYVACRGFLTKNNRITGVRVQDMLTQEAFDIRSKLVINAAGPWSNQILEKLDGEVAPLPYDLALGMNAVLKQELIPTYAAGLPCQEPGPDKGRLMFIVPWRGTTMAGTFYRHHTDAVDAMQPTDADTVRLLSQLNSAMPSAQLTPDHVARIHAGLLPCKPGHSAESDPKLLRHYMLIDHAQRDSVDGLITALGVKYTTARDVADRTISLAACKLDKAIRPSSSATTPLPCGNTDILHAVRNEMAQTLSDVVYRRTGLGATSIPDDATLQATANTMAETLSWDAPRIAEEIARARNPLA